MSDVVVRLRVGGVDFDARKSTLLKVKGTYFHGLLSSGAWLSDEDGAFSIDRSPTGFDRILEYLSSGKLSVDGFTLLEEECMYSNLDYFLIPYKRLWHYDTQEVLEGFRAQCVAELNDGRLCGAYDNNLIVWNVNSCVIEATLKGHIGHINHVTRLHDGRVGSCSVDRTIKLWSIDSGLCDLTLIGHTDDIYRILQLFDGRICSGSDDTTIKFWNTSTGDCEMTLNTESIVCSIAELADGRICCGGGENGIISIFGLMTGERELSWKAHSDDNVFAIVCIGATRICSCSGDRLIKVWNTDNGECLGALDGHTGQVTSMVLMHDGRLFSASYGGISLILWNLETGQSEKNLYNNYSCSQVLQLEDGRLLCAFRDGAVEVWS